MTGHEALAAESLPRSRTETPVPLSYFGMHIHDPRKTWPAMRFGRLRLWDTRTTWFNLQPEPERFAFDVLDAIVEHALARRVNILLCLGMPPRWAASRPDEPSPYGASALGAASEPRSLVEWARFVRVVGERYKGRINSYELWNEVNAGAGFYSGSAEAMLEVQRTAYETLKTVDPGIIFVAPSSVGESDGQLAWFDRYLSLMRGRYADVLSYHFYTPRRGPEALLPLAAKLRRIAERTGNGSMPFWNSESGYRVNWGQKSEPGGTMSTWPNLTPDLAAAWTVRAAVLGWAAGLDAHFSYAFDNAYMGLVGPGMRSSQITDSLSLLIDRMTGARLLSLTRHDAALIARFQRADSKYSFVWAEDDKTRQWVPPLGLPAAAAARLDGEALATNTEGLVSIGSMPVLLAADPQTLRI